MPNRLGCRAAELDAESIVVPLILSVFVQIDDGEIEIACI